MFRIKASIRFLRHNQVSIPTIHCCRRSYFQTKGIDLFAELWWLPGGLTPSFRTNVIDENNSRVLANKNDYKLRQQIIKHPFGVLKRQWRF